MLNGEYKKRVTSEMTIDISKFHLLIHHHHLAYVDKQGVIWLPANIGRWVNALADYIGEIGLLFYQSQRQSSQQDTPITKENVKLFGLGPRKTLQQRFFSSDHLPEICAEAGSKADGLLIRGITPHQYMIWRLTPVAHKSFLLVGSLKWFNGQVPRSLGGLIDFIVKFERLRTLRIMVNNGILMLANSPEHVSEIKTLYKERAYFVPTNSLLVREFEPLQVRSVSRPWKLLYCGRLDFAKGLKELLQTVALLEEQGYSCELDIVGEKAESIYSELLNMAHSLGIAHIINWHGFVPYGEDLFRLYRHADAFVLPTYTEGFPKVFWEAAANSCPVITTSVGGIPALLENKKHALLVPSHDVDALVTAVKSLFSDDQLRQNLVKNAYHYAKTFTVENCAQRLAYTLAQEWN